MKTLTLIPEAESYGLAILVVLGLGCFPLGTQLHARWFANRGLDILSLQVVVDALVVGWGCLVFHPLDLFSGSPPFQLSQVVVGLVAGGLVYRSDRSINRRFARASLHRRRQGIREQPGGDFHRGAATAPRAAPLGFSTPPPYRRPTGAQRMAPHIVSGAHTERFRLWAAITVAVLEELIFRGFLVSACLLLVEPLPVALGLAGTVLVFAASHISYGWSQAVAKLPLAVTALAVTLISGTVVGAVVAHVSFNVVAWRQGLRLRAVDPRPRPIHRMLR